MTDDRLSGRPSSSPIMPPRPRPSVTSPTSSAPAGAEVAQHITSHHVTGIRSLVVASFFRH